MLNTCDWGLFCIPTCIKRRSKTRWVVSSSKQFTDVLIRLWTNPSRARYCVVITVVSDLDEDAAFPVGIVLWAGILVLAFVLLLLAVDVTCYFVNKCGLIMCLCGKSASGTKGKDLEEGKAAFMSVAAKIQSQWSSMVEWKPGCLVELNVDRALGVSFMVIINKLNLFAEFTCSVLADKWKPGTSFILV